MSDKKITELSSKSTLDSTDLLAVVSNVNTTPVTEKMQVSLLNEKYVAKPATSTDNAITRFDGTDGKTIQNSTVTLDDSGNIASPLSIQLGNGSAVTNAAGKIWYDELTGSINAGMGNGNITQQIGEEFFRYGKASAAITDSPLQIVYKTGVVGASGVITFAPTVSGIANPELILGVATESIALNGFGRITTQGIVKNITTDGSAYGETWVDGDDIWYNPTTGNPTKTKPTAPNIKVQVGTVINAAPGGAGSFVVHLGSSSQLGGTDSNVEISSPTNNDLIVYDSTDTRWENKSPATVAGTMNHNDIANKQGGTTNEYYHLTSAQHTVVGNTSGTNSGDVTVVDGTTIDFTLTGQQITAEVKDSSITEAKQSLSDVTTNDVSITKHGYAPKAPNDTAKFLRGDGTWATPTGASPLTTKGDLYTYTTTNARLGVGTNNYVLAADSGTSEGIAWKALGSLFNPPEGYMINGKIVPSVSSNNLTVALKTLAGTDPSSTDPIYIRIGDNIRTITGALSVTTNAGTNWFNSGSSELATKEIDYFVYLGYNSTDGVVLGYARIPSARLYSDFSTTTTNEKYCAISTITNAASGDSYTVIGRFAATLSATASFNWSVSTFTAVNLIQRPIFETRWLDFAGTLAMGGSGSISSTSYSHRRYKITDNLLFYRMTVTGTLGGSATNNTEVKLPFSISNVSTALDSFGSATVNTSGGTKIGMVIYSTSNSVNIRQEASANYPTSGTIYFSMNLVAEI